MSLNGMYIGHKRLSTLYYMGNDFLFNLCSGKCHSNDLEQGLTAAGREGVIPLLLPLANSYDRHVQRCAAGALLNLTRSGKRPKSLRVYLVLTCI